MKNILMSPVCFFVGHDINPEESIVKETMIDKRNWLCQCHRCGLYVMHDGAMSGLSCTMTKRSALGIKADFEQTFKRPISELEKAEWGVFEGKVTIVEKEE